MTGTSLNAVLTLESLCMCFHCRREREKLLSIFEVDLDRSKVKEKRLVTSSSLAVKEFVRSAAGTELAKPSQLRPAHVLMETTEYLINRYSIFVAVFHVGLFAQVNLLLPKAVILSMRSD